jgi:hypothetical protein
MRLIEGACTCLLTVFITLIACVVIAHCQDTQSQFESDSFFQQVVKFNNLWRAFTIPYFNCPANALELSQCQPKAGAVIPYKEFLKMAHEGHKWFATVIIESNKPTKESHNPCSVVLSTE